MTVMGVNKRCGLCVHVIPMGEGAPVREVETNELLYFVCDNCADQKGRIDEQAKRYAAMIMCDPYDVYVDR